MELKIKTLFDVGHKFMYVIKINTRKSHEFRIGFLTINRIGINKVKIENISDVNIIDVSSVYEISFIGKNGDINGWMECDTENFEKLTNKREFSGLRGFPFLFKEDSHTLFEYLIEEDIEAASYKNTFIVVPLIQEIERLKFTDVLRILSDYLN